jgi:hypothetical protein
LHEETTDMAVDPLVDGAPSAAKDPYSGNQAIPTVMFRRGAVAFRRAFPDLRIVTVEWLSLVAYPLSGGFKTWSLITPGMTRALLRLEDAIAPVVGRWLGFRVVVVVEKRSPRSDRASQGVDMHRRGAERVND